MKYNGQKWLLPQKKIDLCVCGAWQQCALCISPRDSTVTALAMLSPRARGCSCDYALFWTRRRLYPPVPYCCFPRLKQRIFIPTFFNRKFYRFREKGNTQQSINRTGCVIRINKIAAGKVAVEQAPYYINDCLLNGRIDIWNLAVVVLNLQHGNHDSVSLHHHTSLRRLQMLCEKPQPCISGSLLTALTRCNLTSLTVDSSGLFVKVAHQPCHQHRRVQRAVRRASSL